MCDFAKTTQLNNRSSYKAYINVALALCWYNTLAAFCVTPLPHFSVVQTKERIEKRSGEGDVDSRIQLEENEGGSTEESWIKKSCSIDSDKAEVKWVNVRRQNMAKGIIEWIVRTEYNSPFSDTAGDHVISKTWNSLAKSFKYAVNRFYFCSQVRVEQFKLCLQSLFLAVFYHSRISIVFSVHLLGFVFIFQYILSFVKLWQCVLSCAIRLVPCLTLYPVQMCMCMWLHEFFTSCQSLIK